MPALEIAAFLLALLGGFYVQQNAKKISHGLSQFKKSPLLSLKLILGKFVSLLLSPVVLMQKGQQLVRLYLSDPQKMQLKVSLTIAVLSVLYAMSQGYLNGTVSYDPLALALVLIGTSVLFVTLVQVFRIVMSNTKISISFRWE